MNHASGLRGGRANRHGPGLDLHLAGREVALEPQRLVGRARQRVQTARLEAQVGQVLRRVLLAQLGELSLDLGADGQGLDAVDGCQVLPQLVLVHVGHVDDGLEREQEELLGRGALVVSHVHRGRTVAVVQPAEQTLGNLELGHELLVALALLLELGQLLLERLDVGQDELGLDGLDVALGVNERVRAVDLAHHVGVGEVTNDLADGIGLADVGQELVAEALARAGALDQARDVDELDRGRHDAPGVHDLCQLLEPAIRHVDDAHVGVDRGKRVVGRKAALLGEGREERRLAHVGQSHDADGE